MITNILSMTGVVFFSFLFLLGFLISLVKSGEFNPEFGRNLMLCLMFAVLCAYLGGW